MALYPTNLLIYYSLTYIMVVDIDGALFFRATLGVATVETNTNGGAKPNCGLKNRSASDLLTSFH